MHLKMKMCFCIGDIISFTKPIAFDPTVVDSKDLKKSWYNLFLCLFRYFQRKIDIFCKFIPELIFLFCMFGYLIILIFYKWVHFDVSRAHEAPSLLIGNELLIVFLCVSTIKKMSDVKYIAHTKIAMCNCISVNTCLQKERLHYNTHKKGH